MRAVDDLEQLALAMSSAGWQSRLLRDDHPPVLRVWHPSVPSVGDTITVAPEALGPGSQPWHKSSTGELVGQCADPQRTAARIQELLGPLVAAIAGSSSPVEHAFLLLLWRQSPQEFRDKYR
ncbi:hypothetical protein [Spirillospora sp. CA-294931]|uniref:hypothetical protein n=1 Tax=Spirillospora sp. CA-294931 TaxID=3240042 RepID=UPI003D940227